MKVMKHDICVGNKTVELTVYCIRSDVIHVNFLRNEFPIWFLKLVLGLGVRRKVPKARGLNQSTRKNLGFFLIKQFWKKSGRNLRKI